MQRSSLEHRCDRGLRLRSRRRDRDTVLHFFFLSLLFTPFLLSPGRGKSGSASQASPASFRRRRYRRISLEGGGEETDRSGRKLWRVNCDRPARVEEIGRRGGGSIDRIASSVRFGPLNHCCSASGEIRRDAAKISFQRNRGTALLFDFSLFCFLVECWHWTRCF